MVSIPDVRELLLTAALIGGFSGAGIVMMGVQPSFSSLVGTSTPTQMQSRSLPIANPVVSITVPEHNIFAP